MFKKIAAITLAIMTLFALSVGAAAQTPAKEDLPKIIGTVKMQGLGAIVGSYLKSTEPNFETYFIDRYFYSDSAIEAFSDGKGDILFSETLTTDQHEALSWDDNLGSEKIAVEALVFLINPENPVKDLTSAQIRSIYSGEITNWKEVGGDDAPITAFQRFDGSSSQELMKKFMFGAPLMPPPIELKPAEMIGTSAYVSAYDNAKYSIGYTTFSYPARLQAEAGNIAFLSVDGVKPSHFTISNGSYPYSEAIYAYYRMDNESTAVYKTLIYLKTDSWQYAVLEAGFMPVRNIAISTDHKVYEAVGTGKEKPEDYKPVPYYSYYDPYAKIDLLDALKDKSLKDEVRALLPETGSDKHYMSYSAINGYLVAYSRTESENYQDTLIIDMFTGERYTEFSDLFYKDADFVPVLSKMFNSAKLEDYYDRPPQKCDRMGLIGTPSFNELGITLPSYNPYYYFTVNAEFDDSLYDLMPIYEYRDMSSLFLPEYRENVVKRDLPYYTEASRIEGDRFYFAVTSRYEDTTVINEQLRAASDRVSDFDIAYLTARDIANRWSYEILDNCFQFYGAGGNSLFIDRESGKILTLSDVFKADYIEKMIAEYPEVPKDFFTDHYNFWVYSEREYGRYTGGEIHFGAALWDTDNEDFYEAEITDFNEKYADIPEKAITPP
jgi:ABC-type phosphate transport system substrate-binding protein